jgi:hypothetical protein
MGDHLEEGVEYAAFYKGYVERSKHYGLLNGLQVQGEEVVKVLRTIPAEAVDSSYGLGKWSVRQLIQHISDTERIFAYRACAIARGENLPIAGYDQDVYASADLNPDVSLSEMVDEFEHLRRASILLFKGFNESSLMRFGKVSNGPMSVRAIGFIMIGHALHHLDILKERYQPLWS